MTITPVSNSATGHARTSSSASVSQSALAANLEESTESAATTKQEAAKGDQVAVRKLARQQQQNQQPNAVAAKEPGKGDLLDHKA
jgi:hypothetical protein